MLVLKYILMKFDVDIASVIIQWVPGAISLGLKWLGCEANHSLPSSAGGQRMYGAIPPLSQYAVMVWCSVKAQGKLYLYLYCLNNWMSFNKNVCG
jgi:hypothetical protein